MKKILLIMLLLFLVENVMAQDIKQSEIDSLVEVALAKKGFKPSKTQFMIRGYGHTGLDNTNTNGEKESSYLGSTFAPIFLFKHSERLMFEAELEFELESNELNIGLEYMNVMFVANDFLTIRAGKFLLPFGTFMERLHPSWINRLPTKPLGFGHDGIAPSSGIGVELRGSANLGGSRINYSVYSTNGPRLKEGSIEPDEAGMLLFSNFEDNNNRKAFGGRFGILPFSDSSIEFGFSAYSSNGTGALDSVYEEVGTFLYALDFSLVKQIPAISGLIDIKSQYNNSKIDNATYFDEDDNPYTFDNNSDSFYTQLSYRPTMADSDFIRKLEIVGRYSNFNAPVDALWTGKSEQYAFGLNYWLTWRSLIKIAYQTTDTIGSLEGDGTDTGFFIHWGIGF